MVSVPPQAPPPRLPLFVVPDVAGPKARLGVVWFGVLASSAAWSRPLLAALLALAAMAASDEIARIHLGARHWPILVAGAALPVGALAGLRGVLGAAAFVCAFLGLSRLLHPVPRRPFDELGVGITGVLLVSMGAAAPVLVAGLGPPAAVTFVVLVSAYEVGDFLVGSGASTPWEGPMAGMVAIAVCGFAAWVLDVAPLGHDGVVGMAVAVAALAPFGPPLGSVLLGSAHRRGRYVRRLDTLIVAGPIAAWIVAGIVHPV